MKYGFSIIMAFLSFAKDHNGLLKNYQVINFDIIHNQCRGNKLNKILKNIRRRQKSTSTLLQKRKRWKPYLLSEELIIQMSF